MTPIPDFAKRFFSHQLRSALRWSIGLALLVPLGQAAAQVAPLKVWDRRFGGTSTTCSGADELFTLVATADGGSLLGGRSSSDAVGDKSEPNRAFGADFWVVKLDAQGNKQWDKRFGGTQIETLTAIQPTPDSGYLLGGYADSGVDGDVSQPGRGANDYWLVKIDAQGNKLWDTRYGGSGQDYLLAIQPTPDGGYLLGGSSRSGSNGDKTEPSRGDTDYWVVKVDAQGAKLWDHRFGSPGEDYFRSLRVTPDGGCLLGGDCLAGQGGDKSEPSKGYNDMWLVKLDAQGTKQWDKTLGSNGFDGLGDLRVLPGGGYLVGGSSSGGIDGDKSEAGRGNGDMWLLRLDAAGTKLWDHCYGGASGDGMASLLLAADGGYLLAGNSQSDVGGDKTEPSRGSGDYWAVKTDAQGIKQWDKTFGATLNDNLYAAQQAADGSYLLAGFTASPVGGDKTQGCWGNVDYWVVKMSAPPGSLTIGTGTLASPTSIPAGTYTAITVTGTGVAELAGNVIVNTGLTVSGTLLTACRQLTGSGSFTLEAGATLGICDADGISGSGSSGAVQTTGPRSFSPEASYLYNGTAAQRTGSGLPAQVRSLTTTNANALTLSGAVSVARTLAVAGTGNLVTNGVALTLQSSTTGTALLTNLGTGQVSGNLTVQRYLDPTLNAGLGYRHLTAPVRGQTVAALGSGGTSLVANPAYNTSATPNLVTPFPSVYYYDQDRLATVTSNLSAFDKGWVSPAALTAVAPVGSRGFTAQLPGGSTLAFTGEAEQGSTSVALVRNAGPTAADAGWNFVGNPYASPLDWSTIGASQRPNVDAAVYVFESTTQYGGQYRSYVNGLGGGNPLIGSSQGFWVRVSAGQIAGSLNLTNANRVSDYTDQASVRRGAADLRPQVQLSLAGSGSSDELYLYAQAGATADVDGEFDATKLANSTGLNLASLSASGQPLAIDGRPDFTAATSIPLFVGVPGAGRYTLRAARLANLPAGLTPYLRDQQTGTVQNLSQQPDYTFQLSAATADGRFELLFAPPAALATAPASFSAQVAVFPNPAAKVVFVELPAALTRSAVTALLVDALGRTVRTQSLTAAATPFSLAGIAAGVYALRLQTAQGTLTRKLTVE
ncbi:T9SS type A sorting domain-containing protein [Hymenobacter sp. ASUV-10]|uniref:T9SS type A sorting domain-containing protein n=1 Tax=Hymenobacter aranciens TaxID=3063996 RepID=A0ABT9B7G0_9BACT|nr:T9SS type A sorting domain-containing protein [Hymenobacter sp. ASUV-10]MDO7873730.1 T9SS type A sorting domain-containing protein [Hymenobacter sp. ASUV-10]